MQREPATALYIIETLVRPENKGPGSASASASASASGFIFGRLCSTLYGFGPGQESWDAPQLLVVRDWFARRVVCSGRNQMALGLAAC